MKKKFISFTFMVLLLGTLTGCGSSNYGGQTKLDTSKLSNNTSIQNTESKNSDMDTTNKKDATDTTSVGTSTVGKNDSSNFDIGNKSYIKGTRKIQLIGTGNGEELPFKVKYIESQAGGITVFTLEDDTKRVVNCQYKEIN